MRVLLVEPYFDGSHRAWAEGYAGASAHDVALVHHRGAFWKWRMQGGAVTLAEEIRHVAAERGRPDVALVSDMVNLPALLGLARPGLDGVPVVLYLHENQLTYPLAPGQLPDLSYGLTNWLGMATADETWCNSAFHRDEVLAALPVLLRHFPDHRHDHLVDEVAARCRVMPVGIAPPPAGADERTPDGPPIVVWNHRWEYDKDPQRFFDAVDRLAASGTDFRLAIAGQNFRRQPAEFEDALRRHAPRIVHAGEAPVDAYRRLLATADVVVSTARHEFFGIAVAEAAMAGCFPVVPARLAYPELVPERHHAVCLYDDDTGLDLRLQQAVADGVLRRDVARDLAADLAARFAWPAVAPRYDAALEDLVRNGPTRGT